MPDVPPLNTQHFSSHNGELLWELKVVGTVIMTTLECMSRSDVLLAPPKYNLSTAMRISHGRALRTGIANGMEDRPSKRASASKGMGMLSKGERPTPLTWRSQFRQSTGN